MCCAGLLTVRPLTPQSVAGWKWANDPWSSSSALESPGRKLMRYATSKSYASRDARAVEPRRSQKSTVIRGSRPRVHAHLPSTGVQPRHSTSGGSTEDTAGGRIWKGERIPGVAPIMARLWPLVPTVQEACQACHQNRHVVQRASAAQEAEGMPLARTSQHRCPGSISILRSGEWLRRAAADDAATSAKDSSGGRDTRGG